jgi:hypothetical protein
MYNLGAFREMYTSLYWKPCCCDEVVVHIIIGEDSPGKKDIADLVKKYINWTPGRTKKYKVYLGNREDLTGRYAPEIPTF